LGVALAFLTENLGGLAPGAIRIAFLTERHDCHCFRELREKGRADLGGGLAIAPTAEEHALVLLRQADPVLYLVAGRQIVTAERIEVLALTVDADIPDGEQAHAVVTAVQAERGIPVVAWAPGKWFFGRGRVVRELMEVGEPGRLLIGDSALRPTVWPEPFLMRRARARGLTVIAGSDPLPFCGEEPNMGTYASVFEAPFMPAAPVKSVREALASAPSVTTVGTRCGPLKAAGRLRKNARAAQSNRGD